MTNFLKKYRTDILLGLGITLVYWLSRLAGLLSLPIFTDEAIYLRWSQIMATDASLRFLPLVDGKPPLFMWATSIVLKVFKNFDPLWVGRFTSISAGFLGLIGVYFASYQLFKNKKISYLSSIFYLLVPFTFFYDRFTTADSLLGALGLWCLGLGVMLFRRPRLDVALILGMVLGAGRLTKTPALFFLALLPVLILLFKRGSGFFKLVALVVLAAVMSEVIFSILRLFPLFQMIATKNAEFTLPWGQLLKNPLMVLPGNLPSLLSWEFWYVTPLVALTALAGVLVGLRKNWRETVVLVAYFVLPVVAMAAINTRIYARYLLPFTPVLFILAAVGLAKLKKIFVLLLVSGLVFLLPLYTDFKLVTDPVNAPIPPADRDQYLDGWPAGFGVPEVRHYLAQLPGKTVLATEGTFGLMPYALELYQKDYPNVEIKSLWPLPDKPAAKYDYLLMYQNQKTPADWKLTEILRFQQGRGTDYLRLYKVL